jgi:hypothetical protein
MARQYSTEQRKAKAKYALGWYHRNKKHRRELMNIARWKRLGMPMPTRPRPTHCESCGRLPGTRGLHLDHDHTTNKFRGWLCSKCNAALGLLGDTLAAVEAIRAYLLR